MTQAEITPELHDHDFMRVPGATDIVSPIILPDHETAVGIINVSGASWRVATISNGAVKHMSPMRAVRLAQEFEGGDFREMLRPVSNALRLVAKIADVANTAERESKAVH